MILTSLTLSNLASYKAKDPKAKIPKKATTLVAATFLFDLLLSIWAFVLVFRCHKKGDSLFWPCLLAFVFPIISIIYSYVGKGCPLY